MGLTDPAVALDRLRRVCDSESDPAVTDTELEDILDQCRVATVRTASTSYAVGDRVLLSPSNGRMYKALEAGSSASSAPTFTGRTQIRDGSVLWEDDGPAHPDLWDMGTAKRMALLAKAQACGKEFDAKEQGVDQKFSQMHAHYQRLAANYDAEFCP